MFLPGARGPLALLLRGAFRLPLFLPFPSSSSGLAFSLGRGSGVWLGLASAKWAKPAHAAEGQRGGGGGAGVAEVEGAAAARGRRPRQRRHLRRVPPPPLLPQVRCPWLPVLPIEAPIGSKWHSAGSDRGLRFGSHSLV
jgi:hypothetical protein